MDDPGWDRLLHRSVVGGITPKRGTWMTEVRVKGKFLGMAAVRGQDQERRGKERKGGVVRDRGRSRRALCQKPAEKV